jgi:hypothetical protein
MSNESGVKYPNRRFLGFLVIVLSIIGALMIVAFYLRFGSRETVGLITGLVTVWTFVWSERRTARQEQRREQKIEKAEQRFQQEPKAPQAAWDLARVKLESYLDRNLSQVRSIYWLTVFVMLFGFLLICVGVSLVYKSPDSFKPGVLAAVCGVVVNFIGATFLFLYKSTMAQATSYVSILERINAVGMSVQILENIDEKSADLKHKTTADLAMQLLAMYSEGGKSIERKSKAEK